MSGRGGSAGAALAMAASVALLVLLDGPIEPRSSLAASPAGPSSVHADGGSADRHAGGPPTGHTGGFGEPTCQACHVGADLNVEGRLVFEGLPAVYQPGATYVITLVLRSVEMEKAGFQAAARFAEGTDRGATAGRFASLDGRITIVPDSIHGLPYIQHAAHAVQTMDPELASWLFEWTAPTRGSDVVLHAAANSANGDDSPLGDLVYTVEARIEAAQR